MSTPRPSLNSNVPQLENAFSEQALPSLESSLPSELANHLQAVADQVSPDKKPRIIVGNPGEGSYQILESNLVVLDPLMIKQGTSSARFVTGHEAAHAAISRSMKELGLSEEYQRKFIERTGYLYIHNILEDPAVNDFMSAVIPELRTDTILFYETQFKNENAAMLTPEVAHFRKELGYTPRFVEFASEIMRDWHKGNFSKSLTPEVTKALYAVLNKSREIIKEIPSPGTHDEGEIIDAARRRFIGVHEYIWPEVEKLIKLDLLDERRRQQINDALNSESNSTSNTNQSGQQSAQGKGISQQNEAEHSGNSKPKLSDAAKKEIADALNAPSSDQSISENENRNNDKIDQSRQAPEAPTTNPSIAPNGTPIDPKKLSKETLEELDRIFEALPAEQKKDLENRAKQTLDKLEEQANSKLNPKHTPKGIPANDNRGQPPSALTYHDLDTIADAINNVEDQRVSQLSAWETERERAISNINDAYSRLVRKIAKEESPEWTTHLPAGTDLDPFIGMQSEADPRLRDKVYRSRNNPTEWSWAVEVLVDTSPSMALNATQTFQALVFISELFEKIKFDLEISEFSDRPLLPKTWENSIRNQDVCESLTKLLATSGGTTRDGTALELGYERLRATAAKHKLILVLSDAESMEAGKLCEVIERVRDENQALIVHFGVGERTKDLMHYYPFSFGGLTTNASNNRNDFYSTFSESLLDIMLNPIKYKKLMKEHVPAGDFRAQIEKGEII